MGLVKDWIDDHRGYTLLAKIEYFFYPKVWFRLAKYRKQRANRGWSDADGWDIGRSLTFVLADVLRKLHEDGVSDYKAMFQHKDMGFTNGEKYKSLLEVANDLEAYFKYDEDHSWADGLEHDGTVKSRWVDKDTGLALTDRAITKRMKQHDLKLQEEYKKTKKAWHFFAENVASFWD